MTFQQHTSSACRGRSPALMLSALASALVLAYPAYAEIAVDQSPYIDMTSVAPNVVLMLDNSVSINRSYMPDQALSALKQTIVGPTEGTRKIAGKRLSDYSLMVYMSGYFFRFPWFSKSVFVSRWQSHALEGRLWFDVDPKTADAKLNSAEAFNVEGGGQLVKNLLAYNPLYTYPAPPTGKLMANGKPERKAVDKAAVDGMHFFVLRSNDANYHESNLKPGKISNYARYSISGDKINVAKVKGFTPRNDTNAYGWLKDDKGQYFYVEWDAKPSNTPPYHMPSFFKNSKSGHNGMELTVTAKYGFSNTAPKTDGSDLNHFYHKKQEYIWGVIDESKAEQVDSPSSRSTFKWRNHDGSRTVERTAAQEVENYANWHKYYRTRREVIRASLSEAMGELPEGIRIGLSTINNIQYNYDGISEHWNQDPAYFGVVYIREGIQFPIPVTSDGGLFTPKNRADLYKNLWNLRWGVGNTPLHNALTQAGEYYSTEAPYTPKDSAGNLLSCRNNYTILATDGYWNHPWGDDASKRHGNQDGSAGKEIKGWVQGKETSYTYQPKAPYKDGYQSTLADVAMKFWKNDLMPSLKNDVPTTARDEAFWQHMTTYALSVGAKGTLDREDDAVWQGLQAGSINWPKPQPLQQFDTTANPAKNVDDLWHATVNSRGQYFVAMDYEGIKTSLQQTLEEIATSSSGSTASAVGATNSNIIDTEAPKEQQKVTHYGSEFQNTDWSGDLVATERDEFGLAVGLAWRASEKMPEWEKRKILFNKQGTLAPFLWANLPPAYKALLGNTTPLSGEPQSAAEKTVEYIRGNTKIDNQAVAGEPNIKWRNRNGKVLGDFINSPPVWVGQPPEVRQNRKNVYKGYETFREGQKNRPPMVYIGGNDGMLHAFDAKTGEEKFAFMPQSVFNDELKNYTRSSYEHHYFVDSELTALPVKINSQWETVLYGSLGRGGDKGRNSIFALKITDPNNPELLWEKTAVDLGGKLGQSMGKGRIVQIAENKWKAIIALGPNSGHKGNEDGSRIAMVDIASGTSTLVLDQSGPGVIGVHTVDTDQQGDPGYGYVDTLYAGDLAGKLYKISGIDGSLATQMIFQTPNGQPITAAPATLTLKGQLDPKKRVVLFGTGKSLTSSDQQDKSTQTWYGIYDENKGGVVSDSDLVTRTYKVQSVTFDGKNQSMALMKPRENDDDMKNKKGWKMDLAQSTDAGKTAKMLLQNRILNKYAIGWVSYYSGGGANSCEPSSGEARAFAVDPFSGAVTKSPTDINEDGNYDDQDLQSGWAVAGFASDSYTAGDPPIVFVGSHAQLFNKNEGSEGSGSGGKGEGNKSPRVENGGKSLPEGYTWREINPSN